MLVRQLGRYTVLTIREETHFEILVVEPQDPYCCTDYDDECVEVVDKLACWRNFPDNGICPYLGD